MTENERNEAEMQARALLEARKLLAGDFGPIHLRHLRALDRVIQAQAATIGQLQAALLDAAQRVQ